MQRESIVISADDILEGIQRNEFEVYFQPKVRPANLLVVGFEAQALWNHAGKPVSPDIFIDAAERNGLIGQLSEVLITKAMLGGARLVDAGFPWAVTVNVSSDWLADTRLPEFVLATIQATGFKAENLILKISETGVVANVPAALDVICRLRDKGCKLSIDGFGNDTRPFDVEAMPVDQLISWLRGRLA